MAKAHYLTKIFFLLITTWFLTTTTQAAAPVGQIIWIRATSSGLFVSADQNRGTWVVSTTNAS